MKVYDTKTKVTETVLGNEGGSIENPRFVLVYDTKYESGDVETRGYDLKTGEVLELAAVPVSLPEEIPNPEQTGEERALVAPTPQVKSKTVSDIDSEDDFDDDSSPEDVLVPVYDTSTSTDSSIVEEADTISDENIPVLDLSNMTQEEVEVAHEIEDLIITSFTEPIEVEDVDFDFVQ